MSDNSTEEKQIINADFRAGAQAMFDMILYKAANHYHGNPEIDELYQIENRIMEEFAEDALEDVDEFAYIQWKNITKITRENLKLTEEIKQLKEKYESN